MPQRPIITRPGAVERPEPHLAEPEAPAPRPAGTRNIFAHRAASAARGDNPPLRFPADQRRDTNAPHLTLSAEDRLIVSGSARGAARSRMGAMAWLLLVVLVGLAGVGAFTVYHAAAGILHP